MNSLQIPLFQARQEVDSILNGSIHQKNTLATLLGIQNSDVTEWEEQGVLVEKLNEKMSVL